MINDSRIKSKDNARLKFARRVRDGKVSEHIFVEGSRLCDEALRSGLSIVSGFVSEEFYGSKSHHLPGPRSDFESFVVSGALLESISDTKSPQGIVLIARRPNPMGLDELLTDGDTQRPLSVWTYLFEVNNPSNLGAVVRTADAAGAKGVLVSTRSGDPFSPKSLRASMGSAFRLPVVGDLKTEEVLSFARKKGIRITAVDSGGTLSYVNVDWKVPRLLVFGSEAHGLPVGVLSEVDETITIPMHGNTESLNLAVSSGIILFEAKRQTDPKGR